MAWSNELKEATRRAIIARRNVDLAGSPLESFSAEWIEFARRLNIAIGYAMRDRVVFLTPLVADKVETSKKLA